MPNWSAFVLLALLCSSVAVAQAQPSADTEFPRVATQPRAARLQSLANFHQVAKNFYRSAQPNSLHLQALYEEDGVRSVISLKTTGHDEFMATNLPRGAVKFTRFELPPQPWTSRSIWTSKQNLVAALRELRRSVQTAPTLLHCTNGSDRTGLVTALYQILYEGWDKGIPRFIREVDVEQLRRAVAVP